MPQTLAIRKSSRARRTLIAQLATFRRAVAAVESRRDFATALQLIDAALALDPCSELGRCLGRIRANVVRMKNDAARRVIAVLPRSAGCAATAP